MNTNLQKEIDECIRDVDFDKLWNESPVYRDLTNAIKAQDQALIYGCLTAVLMSKHCNSQHLEACLRKGKSDYWIGAPSGSEFNLCMRFAFEDMAQGIYFSSGAYRDNFEKLSVAKMTAICS